MHILHIKMWYYIFLYMFISTIFMEPYTKIKTYYSTRDYKSNSYIIAAFMQLVSTDMFLSLRLKWYRHF